MATRVVEWKKPYTWGKAISIDENKVISLNLRDENNLIIYDEWDDEIYVDLQLDDEITPTSAFPIWVNVGRVIVDNWWDKPWTIISAETTSGDNIKIFYADEWTLWIDNWTGTFKQIYFKSDVDALLLALRNYIDWELAKKQNWVVSDTAPSNPSEWDLWYDTTNSAMKVWDWTAWQSVGTGWGGSDIVYATQAEYNALLPWALTDNKHYFIYSTSGWGWWQPWVNTIARWKLDWDTTDSVNNVYDMADRVWSMSYWTLSWWEQYWIFDGNTVLVSTSVPTWTKGTMSAWIYKSSTAEWIILWQCTDTNNSDAYVTSIVKQDQLTFWIPWWPDKSRSYTMSLNTWHHVVFTQDWTNLSVYVDWVQLWTEAQSGWFNYHNWNILCIWGQARGTQSYGKLTWNLSNVIIESEARSLSDIQNYYDQTKSLYWIS